MNLSDFLPSDKLLKPWEIFTESNNGKPFAQSVARNLGEALTNKASADFTNQRILGDAGPQAPTSQSMQTQQLPNGGVQGTSQQNPMMMLVQQWMKTQGGQ